MILYPRSDQEYEDTLTLLQIINTLRERGPGYNPPIVEDTPWIRTCWPKPEYL